MSKITEAYIQARRDAQKWLNSTRDFSEGVSILTRSGYKPVVAAKLARQGKRPHTMEKLIYEMNQMIGVWYDPNDPRFDDVDLDDDAVRGQDGINETVSEEVANAIVQEAANEKIKEEDENQYPPVIQKIIYTFSDCYKSRSILHRQLAELGESNAEEIVTKRKAVVNAINALSQRMTLLSGLKKHFENTGEIPTDEEVNKAFPDPDNVLEEDTKNEEEDEESAFDKLSVEDLKKKKANASTRLCRAKNMLEYSTVTQPKNGEPNPLPDCADRIKYEKKVAAELDLIEKIDYRLAELS